MNNIKETAEEFIAEVKKVVQTVKTEKKLGEDELRVVNTLIFGLYTVVSLVLAVLIRFVASGFVLKYEYPHSRVTDEFIRYTGVFTFVIALLNFASKKWEQKARTDVLRIACFAYCLASVVTVWNFSAGGSYVYVLVLLVSSALAFFHGKASQLF